MHTPNGAKTTRTFDVCDVQIRNKRKKKNEMRYGERVNECRHTERGERRENSVRVRDEWINRTNYERKRDICSCVFCCCFHHIELLFVFCSGGEHGKHTNTSNNKKKRKRKTCVLSVSQLVNGKTVPIEQTEKCYPCHSIGQMMAMTDSKRRSGIVYRTQNWMSNWM